jgi:ornithine carbamoyltransferase
MRSLLSLAELTEADVSSIVHRAVRLATDPAPERTLAGRAVGIYFSKSSTRTRVSFWRAATQLGADVAAFGPDELQLSTGETLADTARVLGTYLDILVVRTNGPLHELRGLAEGGITVVNALTEHEHPTQALADLATLREEFGDLAGRRLLYVGEGNSTAAALVHATAQTPGLELALVTPPGYGLPDSVLAGSDRLGGEQKRITQHNGFDELATPVDCVYTSRWQTMGVPKADPGWLPKFQPFQVNRELLAEVSGPDTIFLHDLPAVRGQEVTADVLDGPTSRAWRQVHHKMTAAMAVLEWCAGR